MRRFLNLEINEVPPLVLKDFMCSNRKSYLNQLDQQKRLHIFSTVADDIPQERLYPAQTWASMNTGLGYDQHKCYWYSDPLPHQLLIWNELAANGIDVGVVGSLHSSKLPESLGTEKKYKFYIPDCFSAQAYTKPHRYINFQKLNLALVAESARVTSGKSLIIELLKHVSSLVRSPSSYGLSRYSLRAIFKIIIKFISSRNKEVLRMVQFPLLASIFYELNLKYSPVYSCMFTNHVAGNMHRYWYAYRPQDFSSPAKYSESWINSNASLIPFSMEIFDDYLSVIKNSNFAQNSTIFVTSSMGQAASNISSEYLWAKFDGRISDLNLFLRRFHAFLDDERSILEICSDSRNMAPQYGFTIRKNLSEIETRSLVGSLSGFVRSLGLRCDISINNRSLVMSIDPYTDLEFHNVHDEKSASLALREYGFDFFPISDHHSGSHSQEGILLLIDPSADCLERFRSAVDSSGKISYLKIKKLLVDSVLASTKSMSPE